MKYFLTKVNLYFHIFADGRFCPYVGEYGPVKTLVLAYSMHVWNEFCIW